jgi:hypothetical protein
MPGGFWTGGRAYDSEGSNVRAIPAHCYAAHTFCACGQILNRHPPLLDHRHFL